MVLNSLRIPSRDVAIDADRLKKGLHQLMSGAAALGEIASELGEKDSTIRSLRDETFIEEALQHFRDRRLRHAEPRSDIDLASLPGTGDQIGNELDVVLDELDASGFPRLPEALDLRAPVDESREPADRGLRALDRHAFDSAFWIRDRKDA